MNILILSDSHSSMHFMRACVERVKPDALVHLGDYAEDGVALHQTFPELAFYQVPGNCDRHRWDPKAPQILTPVIGGVKLYMTHGHQHQVKLYLDALVRDARDSGAQAVLYGHTHLRDCHQEAGLWVINPGSCGGYGGSAGLLTVEDGQILAFRFLTQEDILATGPQM